MNIRSRWKTAAIAGLQLMSFGGPGERKSQSFICRFLTHQQQGQKETPDEISLHVSAITLPYPADSEWGCFSPNGDSQSGTWAFSFASTTMHELLGWCACKLFAACSISSTLSVSFLCELLFVNTKGRRYCASPKLTHSGFPVSKNGSPGGVCEI